jgi:hypothetical protein
MQISLTWKPASISQVRGVFSLASVFHLPWVQRETAATISLDLPRGVFLFWLSTMRSLIFRIPISSVGASLKVTFLADK